MRSFSFPIILMSVWEMLVLQGYMDLRFGLNFEVYLYLIGVELTDFPFHV